MRPWRLFPEKPQLSLHIEYLDPTPASTSSPGTTPSTGSGGRAHSPTVGGTSCGSTSPRAPARRTVGWQERARHLLGQFRAAAAVHPGDQRFAELIQALQEESERFCEWWSRYNVEQAITAKITVRHPDVGTIHIDVIEVKFPAHPGLTMSVHVPGRPADRDKITHLV
ncbi:MAG: MmyB family transcriptional regulator [Acidimicrobiales bacterium]